MTNSSSTIGQGEGEPTMVLTSDLGNIPFPTAHPDWCDPARHLEYAKDCDGVMPAHDVTAHLVSGGEATLDELRNPASKLIERDGGGEWWLDCRQALSHPGRRYSGYSSPPLVRLMVRDRGLGAQYHAQIAMTTGEARVLIHKLQRLVDHVDGGVVQ